MRESELTNFVSYIVSHDVIYDAMLKMNVFAVIAFALFPLLAYIRVILASTDVITQKGIGSAYRDFFMSGFMFILYVFMGFFIFMLMPVMREGFSLFGGVEAIHENFVELWQRIDVNQEENDLRMGWLGELGILLGGFVGTTLGYVAYHIVSVAYRFALSLMEVILAIYIVVQYALGFIAIASKTGGRLLDFSEAWFKSTVFVFIFIFIETIILHLIAVISDYSVGNIIDGLGGETLLAKSNWYLYATFYMVLILIGKVIAAIMANSYANGFSAGNAVVSGFSVSTVIGTFIPKSILPGKKTLEEATPDLKNGQRWRDNLTRRAASGAGSAFSKSVSGVANKIRGNRE